MLIQLLRHPQSTIPRLISESPPRWLVPLVGYFGASYSEGYERIISRYPQLSPFALVALTAVGVLVVGVWAWAGIYGGALHVSARLLGGKPNASGTIRAVGYALFWPGLLAAFCAAAVTLAGYKGGEMPSAATAPLVLMLVAAFWALYTIVAALRAHHGFGWWRAIGSYFLPVVALMLVVLAYLVLRG